MQKVALLSIVFLLLSTVVCADKVAYVVRDTSNPDDNFVSILAANGFTVNLIDDDNAATTDFSQYDLILVGDQHFASADTIPIHTYPSLVANTYYVDDWGFGDWAGSTSVGNNYLKAQILINNTITKNLPSPVQLYDAYGIPAYYLPKLPKRSYDLDVLVASNNYNLYPFIATLAPGDRLYGGGYADARSCFFGITESDYWTSYTETLFLRCAQYAAFGFDRDNDGWFTDEDCDDNNPLVNPDMTEIIYNGWDDDCDASTLDDDLDQDGYDLAQDCDDANSSINPGATDIPYNGIDEDCDGSDLVDADGDTHDYTTDCDDNDAGIYPGATEIPYDGIDQDCSGADLTDVDGDSYDYIADCDDNNPSVNPGVAEVHYNGLDDDCNPATLDDDLDQDSYILADDCDDNNPAVNPGMTEAIYNGLDDDCNPSTLDDDLDQDSFILANDCNDTNPNINPNATEIPYDGIDQDCSGADLTDVDGDSYDYIADCDDNNPQINPGVAEIHYNGIDDDCNPSTLDDDLDQDGFFLADDCNDNDAGINPAATEIPYDGVDQNCDGYDLTDVDSDGFEYPLDCNDTNPNVNPGITETPYNGIDDDCNVSTLDDDLDQDGYLLAEDCDDTNPDVNPGVKEIYFNGIDDDCNPATVDDDSTPPNAPDNLHATYDNGNIVLSWDMPSGEPVEIYNIYTADTPTSFDFSTPAASTSGLTWTDDSAAAQRYYVVRAQDPAGNEETNQYKVGKFDILLQTGYSLVSLPLIPHENEIAEILQGQPVNEILRYRDGFENSVYNGTWHSDFGFNTLHNNEGYFFKTDASFTLTLTGAVADSVQTVALEQGLNLVGFTSLASSLLSDAFSQTPAYYLFTDVARFSNGNYQISTYYPGADKWYSAEGLTELMPGNGYWLKANQETSWSYQP